MISSITTAKGTAVMITSDCRPCSAVSPPSSSITTAMPPITRPQKTTTSLGGLWLPLVVRMPITTEAESAAVMKKIARMTMIRIGRNSAKGRFSTIENSTWAGFTESIWPSEPSRYIEIAVPPMIPYARKSREEGMRMTPSTNWRMVRPREMRAMKMPTKGDHEIHQAQ